ncbi:growth hormone secretagogue receptor type 1-like isoform X1 [Haliotis rufescens]|uniref:growth hormone secretagogue receptor type 1-like isoform X1 n=2 Tax=Haliotis rufescens TaxID=6454 RepID=UPI001EB006CC|nr:growth hormone secretagogue receptor type 1-like isoform X1 [Haliotis rufescens]XP_046366770.1 growth hormone secretagogue receptor type 1-like isoform X1 [Haliotis rufescens]XP_046366771.1 growth hormone secretagogue receptor type 1-like isoform X1 [Haliotis rufescens]
MQFISNSVNDTQMQEMSNNTTASPAEFGSIVFHRYSTAELLETFAPLGPYSEKFIPPLWYAVGFVCNPASAVIWLGRRMRRNNSSAIYLGALSISDLIFLFLHLLYTLHGAWGYRTYNTSAASCATFMFFYYTPQYLSTLLVLGFTVERYVAVCHPFQKEKWCTVRRACVIVCVLLFFSAAVASAQIYFWTYTPEHGACHYRQAATEGDAASFVNIWSWVSDLLIFGAIPLIVLCFNALVLKEICKLAKNGVVSRQSGSASTTASTVTLLSVSFFLIITQLTATVVFCMETLFPHGDIMMTDEEIREDPTWSKMFSYLESRKIIECLCLSHFALYFAIYCLTGKHFRKEVLYMLTCCGRFRSFQDSFSRKHNGEKYSMVSSNGHLMSETCTTTFTTNF